MSFNNSRNWPKNGHYLCWVCITSRTFMMEWFVCVFPFENRRCQFASQASSSTVKVHIFSCGWIIHLLYELSFFSCLLCHGWWMKFMSPIFKRIYSALNHVLSVGVYLGHFDWNHTALRVCALTIFNKVELMWYFLFEPYFFFSWGSFNWFNYWWTMLIYDSYSTTCYLYHILSC